MIVRVHRRAGADVIGPYREQQRIDVAPALAHAATLRVAKARAIGNQAITDVVEELVADDQFIQRAVIVDRQKIGRAQVCTQVTNAHDVYRLMLEKKHDKYTSQLKNKQVLKRHGN